MLVKDRMTLNPITAHPHTTHKEAATLLREHGVHHLPIVDKKGQLVGIIVEDDLFAAQPTPATTLSIYEIHSLLSKLQLKEIMRHPVHTVNSDCSLEEAANLMITHEIGCLPVVDNNQLVGIITDTDIFRAFVNLLGGEEEGARFTLSVLDEPGTLAKIAQAVADAGGNIVSLTTWDKGDPTGGFITVKERGADFAQLSQALNALDAKVIDVREKPTCSPQKYG